MQISVGSVYQTHSGSRVTVLSETAEGDFCVSDGGPMPYLVDKHGFAIGVSNTLSLSDSPSDCDTCAFFNNDASDAPCNTCLSFGEWQPVNVQPTKDTNPKDLIGVRKAPMSTVSAPVLAELGVAMLEGACKYGRHNYRIAGVRASVYYDAGMRHMMSWWEGEDTDPDSGVSHVTKAIATLVVLRDAMIQGKLTDDRAPRSVEFYKALNERAGQVIDRYADRAPRHYTIAD